MSAADWSARTAAPADIPIIETRDVSRHFSVGTAVGRGRPRSRPSTASRSTSAAAQTLALVGETGSGKTTFGRLLLGLYPPTSGDILYDGESILDPRARPPGPSGGTSRASSRTPTPR